MFSSCASADENGISFWLPGLFGSLAATPQQPGWALANIYYHTSVSAGADVARAREFTLGRVPANLTLNANLNLHQRHRQSWLSGPELCIRDARARRPGVSVPLGSLWRRRHQPGGDLVRRGHRAVRQRHSLRAVRHHQRHDMGLWGSGADVPIEMERRRQQLHDLPYRRHPGWRLPIYASVEPRHRTRRDRCRRRLHLFQSADRPPTVRLVFFHSTMSAKYSMQYQDVYGHFYWGRRISPNKFQWVCRPTESAAVPGIVLGPLP